MLLLAAGAALADASCSHMRFGMLAAHMRQSIANAARPLPCFVGPTCQDVQAQEALLDCVRVPEQPLLPASNNTSALEASWDASLRAV